ncbi:trypsin-like serine protease, partial [Actinopolyspora saharensis]|uniref:trypsin-like serine protease n=1 Tax=Actinopolyspora saharensis TaxID=995062 RepID=UPI003182E7EB
MDTVDNSPVTGRERYSATRWTSLPRGSSASWLDGGRELWNATTSVAIVPRLAHRHRVVGASRAAGAVASEPGHGEVLGRSSRRGGEPADVADHRGVVYLVDAAGKQFCGGAVAASDKVVTAGHCVADQ